MNTKGLEFILAVIEEITKARIKLLELANLPTYMTDEQLEENYGFEIEIVEVEVDIDNKGVVIFVSYLFDTKNDLVVQAIKSEIKDVGEAIEVSGYLLSEEGLKELNESIVRH